ncbi:hypothetical protein [uncultured Brevibacillus sp.]|uniref:hypothetical protein n=1 Tax=uncultured Brevibacillus sp. TaxID=169970 RepID=UPI00259897A4|nr:hypothetical protein [uncultured Brevibacillus sp.]
MQRLIYVEVEPKIYGQLAVVVFLFVTSFFIWITFENQNRIFTDDFYSEKAMLSGVMYKVELDTKITGSEDEFYSFVTSEKNLDRVQMDEENQFTLTHLKQEIHSLAGKESRLVFSFMILLFIMLCWLILRKHSLENALHALAFVACSYYLLSIWQTWLEIRQTTDAVTYYIAKL